MVKVYTYYSGPFYLPDVAMYTRHVWVVSSLERQWIILWLNSESSATNLNAVDDLRSPIIIIYISRVDSELLRGWLMQLETNHLRFFTLHAAQMSKKNKLVSILQVSANCAISADWTLSPPGTCVHACIWFQENGPAGNLKIEFVLLQDIWIQ